MLTPKHIALIFLNIAALPLHGALISVYQFDETSGTIADDYVRSAVGDATLVNFGGSQWVTGQIGNALNFDGTNDYAWTNDPIATGATKLSLSSWVYLDNVGGTVDSWAGIATNWPGAFLMALDSSTGRL